MKINNFGYNHANAILTLGIKDSNIYILNEIYVHEKTMTEIISIAERQGLSKRINMWCDSAEQDRIKMWQQAGYKAHSVNKGGSKGSVNAQIEWLKGIISKNKAIDRKIFVHPSCVNTIKELQQWKWRKDEKSGEYLDEPVPFQDDAMSALRYGVELWRKTITLNKTLKGGI